MSEPNITINGQSLTEGQAATVRVVCTTAFSEMIADPKWLGDDAHGRRMTELYRDRMAEVMKLFAPAKRRTEP